MGLETSFIEWSTVVIVHGTHSLSQCSPHTALSAVQDVKLKSTDSEWLLGKYGVIGLDTADLAR